MGLLTLSCVTHRYGNISYGEEAQKAFAQHFLDNWAVTLLQIVMEQLSQFAQGQYVSPRVLQRSLEYVENAVNHGKTWKVMKAHAQVRREREKRRRR